MLTNRCRESRRRGATRRAKRSRNLFGATDSGNCHPSESRALESLHNSELSCHNHRFQKRLRPVCDQDRASQQKPLPDQWLREDHRQLCSDSNHHKQFDERESFSSLHIE
jgi:hypothetical protein